MKANCEVKLNGKTIFFLLDEFITKDMWRRGDCVRSERLAGAMILESHSKGQRVGSRRESWTKQHIKRQLGENK